MYFLIIALCFCCLSAALPQKEEVQQKWLQFKLKYAKKYRNLEENQRRFTNFKNNIKLILENNERFEQGLVSYRMTVNPFTDMDLKDMENSYMGLKINKKNKQLFLSIPQFKAPVSGNRLYIPNTLDWRECGAVSPVKDQENCGSCWAFSSTAALEAHHYLKYKKSVILSEQNLIDCVTDNWGCGGGWMIPCFDYVHHNGGINPETKYPYQAVDGKCRFQREYIAVTCAGYRTIRQGDEQHLLEAVATVGPIAVAISVNNNFINYVDGIYDDPSCSQFVNHAVLVVGYGSENGTDYWLVKNSWGTSWGDKGYIKMIRNKNNQCSIANYGSYPIV